MFCLHTLHIPPKLHLHDENSCFSLGKNTAWDVIYRFVLIAGAGVHASPGPMATQTPFTYGMQRVPVAGHSTGHPAQFLSNVGPGPQASYIEQAVPAGVNYPWQVSRETLAPYVPLPPFRESGMS